MAYNAVPTVATGDLWSAANHNTYIRDNFAAGVPDIFTTKGDLAVASGADAAGRLGVGSNGQVLRADSAETLGVKWGLETVPDIFTTKGDLAVASGADAVTRLAAGTNHVNVLVPNSGTSAGLQWRGASYCKVSLVSSSIPNGTYTVLSFTTEDYDTDGFWSSSPNPDKIYIPSGFGGLYLIVFHGWWASNSSGYRQADIKVNGIYDEIQNLAPVSGSVTGSPHVLIRNLSAGDYVQVVVYQTSGSNLNLNNASLSVVLLR